MDIKHIFLLYASRQNTKIATRKPKYCIPAENDSPLHDFHIYLFPKQRIMVVTHNHYTHEVVKQKENDNNKNITNKINENKSKQTNKQTKKTSKTNKICFLLSFRNTGHIAFLVIILTLSYSVHVLAHQTCIFCS